MAKRTGNNNRGRESMAINEESRDLLKQILEVLSQAPERESLARKETRVAQGSGGGIRAIADTSSAVGGIRGVPGKSGAAGGAAGVAAGIAVAIGKEIAQATSTAIAAGFQAQTAALRSASALEERSTAEARGSFQAGGFSEQFASALANQIGGPIGAIIAREVERSRFERRAAAEPALQAARGAEQQTGAIFQRFSRLTGETFTAEDQRSTFEFFQSRERAAVETLKELKKLSGEAERQAYGSVEAQRSRLVGR